MIKINRFEAENVKRIRAVKVEPSQNGLTIVGGKNNAGKTSVLDAIAWALGGEKYRPSAAMRESSVIPPYLHVVLSNGLEVERKGKNSDLKVIDPDGRKGGQQLLNEFVEQLAIDLPRFMQAGNRDKADTLLQIIGVGEQLHEMERRELEIYNRRHALGQVADQKSKFAAEMTYWPDAPKEPMLASELIKRQQEILARNGENQAKRRRLAEITQRVQTLTEQLRNIQNSLSEAEADLAIAQKSAADLQDESTVQLEQDIIAVEAVNVKVRANLDKERAEDEAQAIRGQYNTLTAELDAVRKEKTALLEGADLPLPELSVQEGELVYKGFKWDSMSASDQLKVSTAIVRRLNPKCGFVLLDKLEQMDMDTLHEFGQWLEAEGLQAIATRVSTGDECSIIIEDGYVAGQEQAAPAWTEGEF